MKKISKLEENYEYLNGSVDTCYPATNQQLMDKINEIIDRLNSFEKEACYECGDIDSIYLCDDCAKKYDKPDKLQEGFVYSAFTPEGKARYEKAFKDVSKMYDNKPPYKDDKLQELKSWILKYDDGSGLTDTNYLIAKIKELSD